MTADALLDVPSQAVLSAHTVGSDVLQVINEQHVVTLDGLIALMPEYSWNQIIQAVDRLARCRRIVLRRHGFDYTVFSTSFAA